MPVAIGRLAIHQLGPDPQKRAHLLDVAGAHGFDQARDGKTIDERFEFWPTFESVAAREHELRLVQSEFGAGVAIKLVHLGDSAGITGEILIQEFFRLTAKMFQVRPFG
jgi:hypothetical protein